MSNVHQSRFGFHPCDHDTYLKLKALKKLFYEAQRVYGSWRRWDRKQPENRFSWLPKGYSEQRKRSDIPIPEPLRFDHYAFKAMAVKWAQQWAWVPVSTWRGSKLQDRGILAAFERARMPVMKAEDVKPLPLTVEEIDTMLDVADAWMKARKG